MSPVAIIVPVYKNEMNQFELISMQQCLAILGKYPIIFICPKNMEFGLFHIENRSKAEFVFFEDDNFVSIIAYNRMMLSVWFYKHFINYKYILIYQLDCFVFKDELMFWVEQGYSYIGAPWFLGNSSSDDVNELIGVGNGGFSLRNIKDSIRVLKSRKKIKSLRECVLEIKNNKARFFIARILQFFLNEYSFKRVHKNRFINEDKIFSIAGKRFNFFKVPDTKIALAFAFEKQPDKLFKLNNSQLPFGCHAWCKYNLDFYIPIFKKLGYTIHPLKKTINS